MVSSVSPVGTWVKVDFSVINDSDSTNIEKIIIDEFDMVETQNMKGERKSGKFSHTYDWTGLVVSCGHTIDCAFEQTNNGEFLVIKGEKDYAGRYKKTE